MNKLTLVACLAAAFGSVTAAHAQTAPAAPAAAAPAVPSLGAVIGATQGLTVTGYVAASYTHFDTTPALRQFDTTQNGFTFNQAALTVSYLPASGAGAAVTLIGGSDAQIIRNGELSGSTTSAQFDVLNAYAQYATGPVTVMAGKFSTLAGAEVVSPVANSEISRSMLFTLMEPISHTGVRAAYAVSDALTLTGGVNNGFNYTSTPTGTSKTVELGASGTPNKMFSYSAAFYSGQTPLFGGSTNGTAQLLDLVGTINATDALNFVANVDVLSKDGYKGPGTGKGKATGLALYANYAVSDLIGLSARGEYIDDKDGIVSGMNGTSNKLKELSLAVNVMPSKNMKFTAEVRQDKADVAMFTKGSSTSSSQTSIALQALYSF